MGNSTAQAEIGRALDRIEAAYTTILEEVQAISANGDPQQLTEKIFGEISKHVEIAGSLGAEAAELYQQMPSEQRQSPGNLERQTRIEGKVRNLLHEIGQLETSTRKGMDELAPQIHKGVLGMKMRQAYGSS